MRITSSKVTQLSFFFFFDQGKEKNESAKTYLKDRCEYLFIVKKKIRSIVLYFFFLLIVIITFVFKNCKMHEIFSGKYIYLYYANVGSERG